MNIFHLKWDSAELLVIGGIVSQCLIEYRLVIQDRDKDVKSSEHSHHVSLEVPGVDVVTIDTFKQGAVWVVVEEAVTNVSHLNNRNIQITVNKYLPQFYWPNLKVNILFPDCGAEGFSIAINCVHI